VTTLLARSLRGDDWLAGTGPAEFVVLLNGPVAAGEVLRRATLSPTAARRVGAGTVIRYREPV
jgi:hypothetical protein